MIHLNDPLHGLIFGHLDMHSFSNIIKVQIRDRLYIQYISGGI